MFRGLTWDRLVWSRGDDEALWHRICGCQLQSLGLGYLSLFGRVWVIRSWCQVRGWASCVYIHWARDSFFKGVHSTRGYSVRWSHDSMRKTRGYFVRWSHDIMRQFLRSTFPRRSSYWRIEFSLGGDGSAYCLATGPSRRGIYRINDHIRWLFGGLWPVSRSVVSFYAHCFGYWHQDWYGSYALQWGQPLWWCYDVVLPLYQQIPWQH